MAVPGFPGDGAADGVECGDAVGGGGVEVAAQAAPAGEGGQGMPVAGHGLVAFRGFRSALRDVIRPADGEARVNRKTCSFFHQPGAEGVAGVVPAAVPVPQPVVDDPDATALS